MKERLIWKPNQIPLEEWETLSREEQIQWWKNEEAKRPKKPRPNPLVFVKEYEKGMVTLLNTIFAVINHLTEENVEEFMANCPEKSSKRNNKNC